MALNRPPKPLPIFFRIIRRFWPSIRKQRVLIAGSFLALAGEISFRLLEPWPLKFIFDGLITTKHSRRHIPDWIHGLDPMTMVCLASLALIAITMLRALADYWNTVGFSLAGNRVLTEVRNELYRHLQRLSLSFHTRTRNGDLALRVIGDVNMLKDATVTALLPLMASSLVLIGMPIVMLWLNWQLALLALVPTPLMWISTMRLGKRIREAARKQRRRQGEIAATAAESMGAIQIVQALSLEGRFSEYFDARSRTEQNEDIKGSRLSARLGRTVEGLLAISMSLVLVHGVWLIQHRVLTPGDLLVFLGYLKSAFRPIRELAKYASRLSKALAAGERVLDIFEQTPDVRDLPDAVPAPAFQGADKV